MGKDMTNVILLILDALRYDHVTPVITPNLLKIAEEGVFFKYALAGNTATVKSIPCMLCADFEYDPEENIPTALKHEGYTTAAFHSSPLFGQHFSHGFDVFEDLHSHTLSSNRRVRKYARKLLPHALFTKMKNMVRAISDSEKYLPYMRAREMLQIAQEWMKTAPEPFFIWIHLMDPHMPYYPIEDTGISRKDLIKFNDKLIEAAYKRANLTNEEIELAKMLYRKEVSHMDEAVGDFLKTYNRDDILIITSDHGEEFGEFGDFSHPEDKFIPPLLRVPLIMVGKGIKKEIREDDFSHLELAPTIFELLGIKHDMGIWKKGTKDKNSNPHIGKKQLEPE